jgi:hypothetical protein
MRVRWGEASRQVLSSSRVYCRMSASDPFVSLGSLDNCCAGPSMSSSDHSVSVQ